MCVTPGHGMSGLVAPLAQRRREIELMCRTASSCLRHLFVFIYLLPFGLACLREALVQTLSHRLVACLL